MAKIRVPVHPSNLAIIVIAAATMFLATSLLVQNERQRLDEDAERWSTDIAVNAHVEFSLLQAQLLAIAASAKNSTNDFVMAFHLLVAARTSVPGAPKWNAIGYAPEVDPLEVPALEIWVKGREAEFRSLGYRDFKVFPGPLEGATETLFPVLLVDPVPLFQPVFGFDFASESIRQTALRHALEEGGLRLTQSVVSPGADPEVSKPFLAIVATDTFDWLVPNDVGRRRRGAIIAAIDLREFFRTALLNTHGAAELLRVRDSRSTTEFSVCGHDCDEFSNAGLLMYRTEPKPSKLSMGDMDFFLTYSEMVPYSRALVVSVVASILATISIAFLLSYFLTDRRKQKAVAMLDRERERDLNAKRQIVTATAAMNAHFYNVVNGILHELNNTIGIGSGHLAAAQRDTSVQAAALRHLAKIEGALELAGTLGKRLDLFEPSELGEKIEVRIHDLVSEVEAAVKRVSDVNIVLSLSEGAEDCIVRVAPLELRLALMNLVFNGLKAIEDRNMPSAGVLILSSRTGNDPIPGHLFGLPSAKGDMFVQISVTDDGVGLSEFELRRLGEAGYTSKSAVEKGHGFGISSVQKFANENAGSLEIFSQLGVGTTVTLVLPLRVKNAPTEKTTS